MLIFLVLVLVIIFIFKYLEKRERFKVDFLKETVLRLIKWAPNIKTIEVLLFIERLFFSYLFIFAGDWSSFVFCVASHGKHKQKLGFSCYEIFSR